MSIKKIKLKKSTQVNNNNNISGHIRQSPFTATSATAANSVGQSRCLSKVSSQRQLSLKCQPGNGNGSGEAAHIYIVHVFVWVGVADYNNNNNNKCKCSVLG